MSSNVGCVQVADDDEGFVEPVASVERLGASSGASGRPPAITTVHDTASSSLCSGSARHSYFASERSRFDSMSDSSVGMAVFGSPDVAAAVPHLWTSTTQPPSDNEQQPQPTSNVQSSSSSSCSSSAKLPFCHRAARQDDTDDDDDEEEEEDDMEGTDLLHLISHSLDRFNAIVHPDDLSSSTSGVGTSCCLGSGASHPLLSASRSLDDFPPNDCLRTRSDQTHDASGGLAIDQPMTNKSTEVKFSGRAASSWLSQYSVSCPTETHLSELGQPFASAQSRLFGSAVEQIPSVGSNVRLPAEAEDYLRELGASANKENPQNLSSLLHLPSSFCALASTLLDPDSSPHVTTTTTQQVKDSTTCSLDTSALSAPTPGSKDSTIPPPGFPTPNWADLLLTRTPHSKDEENNSSARRRESVLTALQDSAIRTHDDSSWFGGFHSRPVSDWTDSSAASTHTGFLDPMTGLVDRADSQPNHTFVRPLLAGCGRSRLLSSCLCSEHESKFGVSSNSDQPPSCSSLFSSDWNVSSLPKEFAESLRFLIPNSSGSVGSSGQHRSAGPPNEPSAHTLCNGHAASTPNVNPNPLTRLLSGAGRQSVASKGPGVKSLNGTNKTQQEKMRTPGSHQRRFNNPAEPTPLLTASFGRPSDGSFFRPQRHASLSCSANHNNTRHASRSSGGGSTHNGTPQDSGDASKPTVAKWRRACSFYLRGHCKKEDCEFAHDLTKVTCKFWEMGECFKGATCPFLHGYPPELAEVQP